MAIQDTADQLLDAAQRLVQERGFNAFSYRDLAETVGIRTASIHYHFKAKADLGKGLMGRYHARLEEALAAIDAKPGSAKSKLKAFISLYKSTEAQGAICVCGSMASDWETLGPPVQELVTAYLQRSESWVARQVREGCRSGEFPFSGKPSDAGASLVASLQGGLILARTGSGTSVLSKVQSMFFGTLGSK